MNAFSMQETKIPAAAKVPGQHREILIVEDDPDAIEELSEIIELEGWKVLTARNVSGALAVIENSDVKLVITDVHLGGGSGPMENGIQFVSRAQALFPDRELSFVVLSGDVDAVKSSLQTDAVDFLLKPVSSDALITAINQAEHWSGKERELSDFAEYLIRKSGRPDTPNESPIENLITSKFSKRKREEASAEENTFALQYLLGTPHLATGFDPVTSLDGSEMLALEPVPLWTDDGPSAPEIRTFLDQARLAGWASQLNERIRDTSVETFADHMPGRGASGRLIALYRAEDLSRKDGIPALLGALAKKNLAASQVIVEVIHDQSLDVTSSLMVKSLLAPFGDRILRVDVNDFTTACGFVTRMRDYGFDWVRLSMNNMPDWDSSPDAKAQVKTLIALARVFDIKVIVDHVDTIEALDWLNTEGCDAVQGKAVSGLITEDGLDDFLRNGKINEETQA